MPSLADIPRPDVAAVLSQCQSLPMDQERQQLYKWALSVGGDGTLVEEVMASQSGYSQDIAAYNAAQKLLADQKAQEYAQRVIQLKSNGLWDDAHNCEMFVHDPSDIPDRFERNSNGNMTDVTWVSNS